MLLRQLSYAIKNQLKEPKAPFLDGVVISDISGDDDIQEVEADLANTTVIPQRAVVSDTLPTEEPQPGPSSAPDIIPEVQLRTARVMPRDNWRSSS